MIAPTGEWAGGNPMTSMWLAALFWLGLHFIIAGPLRGPLVDKLGDRPFQIIFSLLSIAGVGWFIVAYRAAPYVALWPTPPALGWLAFTLVFLGFLFAVIGIGPANPTDTHAPKLIDSRLPVYGITRVTRHPRLCGVSLWATAHLMVNGHLAAVLMFGALLVTAVNGMASIDRKRRRALGGVLGHVREADLAPSVRRHPRRPHPLRAWRAQRLAGHARGGAFRRRLLAAWHHRAIAACDRRVVAGIGLGAAGGVIQAAPI